MKKSVPINPRLDGQELIAQCRRTLQYEQYGLVEHTFYEPMQYKGLWIHIWYVAVTPQKRGEPSSRYHCSLYEDGRIIQPENDARFVTAHKKRFGSKQWTECYFTSHLMLIQFLREIQL